MPPFARARDLPGYVTVKDLAALARVAVEIAHLARTPARTPKGNKASRGLGISRRTLSSMRNQRCPRLQRRTAERLWELVTPVSSDGLPRSELPATFRLIPDLCAAIPDVLVYKTRPEPDVSPCAAELKKIWAGGGEPGELLDAQGKPVSLPPSERGGRGQPAGGALRWKAPPPRAEDVYAQEKAKRDRDLGHGMGR